MDMAFGNMIMCHQKVIKHRMRTCSVVQNNMVYIVGICHIIIMDFMYD